MAQAALGQTTEEQIATLRDWYNSFDVETNESADRMLALSFYAYAQLSTGDNARLVREIWPALRALERGPDGIYRFPATIHYVTALAAEGQTRKARDYLAYLLNEGYWYNSCPKAFHCPQAPALKEQLRRMQVYRPLMGQ